MQQPVYAGTQVALGGDLDAPHRQPQRRQQRGRRRKLPSPMVRLAARRGAPAAPTCIGALEAGAGGVGGVGVACVGHVDAGFNCNHQRRGEGRASGS